MESADSGQDVRRVGALAASFLDQSEFPAPVQQGIQKELFESAHDQAGAILTEPGMVEAGIRQFQGQGVLPVDAAADGIRGLTIG